MYQLAKLGSLLADIQLLHSIIKYTIDSTTNTSREALNSGYQKTGNMVDLF